MPKDNKTSLTEDLAGKPLYSWYEEPLDDATKERLKEMVNRRVFHKGAYGIRHDFDEYHGNRSNTPGINGTQRESSKENLAYWLDCELSKQQLKHGKEIELLHSLQRQLRTRGDGHKTGTSLNLPTEKHIKECKKRISIIELQILDLKAKFKFHKIDRS